MNFRIKITLLSILTALVTTTQAEDTIVFKNGDTLTGNILSQDAEHIQFKSKTLGTLRISTADLSKPQTTDTPPPERQAPPKANKPEQKTDQAQKKPQATPPKTAKKVDKWSGQAGIAIAMRESNTLRRSGDSFSEKDESFESYRLYGNVKWKSTNNNLKWDWTYRYSRTDLRKNDDYLNLTQNYQHDFTKKYFTSSKTMYQQDFRRGIDSEYLQTAEIGIKWLDTPKLKFATSTGAGYHYYDRIQNEQSQSEGKFIIDESLRWQIINSLTLFQKYTHLGNLNKYHFVFTSGLENKLIHDIFLRLEYRLDRDTEMNYDDRGYYDKALLTSLLYKF